MNYAEHDLTLQYCDYFAWSNSHIVGMDVHNQSSAQQYVDTSRTTYRPLKFSNLCTYYSQTLKIVSFGGSCRQSLLDSTLAVDIWQAMPSLKGTAVRPNLPVLISSSVDPLNKYTSHPWIEVYTWDSMTFTCAHQARLTWKSITDFKVDSLNNS